MAKDERYYNVTLADGAEVFIYQDRLCYKYNAKLKIAGDTVKVQFFENGVMCGFAKNREAKREYTYDAESRFKSTGNTARKRLYDYVAANIGIHRDNNGKRQTLKFFTCTFRNNIKDMTAANKELKRFIQRLNYHFTRDKDAAFLQYIAVPELQQETGRDVWHYHILFFNMPFLPVSSEMVDKLVSAGSLAADYDRRDTLFYIWGQGSVDVKALPVKDVYDAAGYMAKYIGKGLEGRYEEASARGILNKKRFLHSKKLIGAKIRIAFLNKRQRQAVVDYFKKHSKKYKRKGKLKERFEVYCFKNDYVGRIFGIDFRAHKKHVFKVERLFDQFSYGLFDEYISSQPIPEAPVFVPDPAAAEYYEQLSFLYQRGVYC